MVKIFIPAVGSYRDIDQIVAFGCSMTQGDEICDQKRYPEIPDVEATKKELGYDNWLKLTKTKLFTYPQEHYSNIQNEERSLAWPSQLGKLYGIPVYNRAEGASSFEKQITQFLISYNEGLITPTTLVLWGFTQSARGLLLEKDEICSYLLTGHVVPRSLSKNAEHFWYTSMHSDLMILWKYYQCLQIVFHWASTICRDQFMFIQSLPVFLDYDHMPKWEQEKISNPQFIEFIRPFWHILRNDYDVKYPIFKDYNCQNFYNWAHNNKFVLGGGHPSLEGHIKYAKLIQNQLDNLAK